LADRERRIIDGKVVYVDTGSGDARTNPLYACEVGPPDEDGHRPVLNWMAFDPKYGPESVAQIEWHVAHGTPGAELWEVGVPV
jgi:hypothetical protein